MLQRIPFSESGAQDESEYLRREFLRAYEHTYGNVSASCDFCGISRQTYYRWIHGDSDLDKWFKAELEAIKPEEKLLDLGEAQLVSKINQGDVPSILFLLRTKGRSRGYSERPDQIDAEREKFNIQLQLVREGIEQRARSKGVEYQTELRHFLETFGHNVKPEIRERLAKEAE